MRIEWKDEMATGIAEIDNQHRQWIDFYNRLDEIMLSDDKEELKFAKAQILEEMSEYVDFHFQFEEEYMRKIGFPEVERHWRLHKNFRNEIYTICRSYREGNIVLNTEIMNTIKNWLIDHIMAEDMKMKPFV